MGISLLLLIAAGAYLLGSIPFGYLLVRVFRSEDIRKTGSGNIGATNVVRSGAKGLGAATLVLDMLKGFLAVGFAREMMAVWTFRLPGAAGMGWHGAALDTAAAVAAIAAVLGHIYPVWLRFKGGKGVATAFGVLVQMVPLAALLGVLVFLVVVFASRYVSLASIASAAAIPLAALLVPSAMHVFRHGQATVGFPHGGLWQRPALLIAVVLIPALVIAKHHANIRRLIAGTEYRFGNPKAAAAAHPA